MRWMKWVLSVGFKATEQWILFLHLSSTKVRRRGTSSSSSIGATTLGGFRPAWRFRSTIFYLYTSLSNFSLSSSLNHLLPVRAISVLVFLLVLRNMVPIQLVFRQKRRGTLVHYPLCLYGLHQCFSTFVRPRHGKFFFLKTRASSQQIYSSVPF